MSTVHTPLLDRLPTVRGSYREKVLLKDLTWFRVGGPADILFRPADWDDLAEFVCLCPPDIPRQVIGVGSNLLVRDGGLDGVTIRLGGKAFGEIQIEENRVRAGAAALDAMVARQAAKAGLKGLGFLVGVPGTIGGALAMNAGAHGGETKDYLVAATVLTDKGEIKRLQPHEIGHRYRGSAVPKDWIFLEAEFECPEGDRNTLVDELKAIQTKREETQPIKSRTGGSTFKNPEGHSAWKLVDQAGCRGYRVGGALMSPFHCNFMINDKEATAADLENLGETVRRRVLEQTNQTLSWEIKRLGRHIGTKAEGETRT